MTKRVCKICGASLKFYENAMCLRCEVNSMKPITIKHPNDLSFSSPQKSIDLYLEKRLPNCIAGWMIVVGLKHPLRCVYGSDLRAALALLWQATGVRVTETVYHWTWSLTHRAEEKQLAKLGREKGTKP